MRFRSQKKWLSLLLIFTFLFGLFGSSYPTVSYAQENEEGKGVVITTDLVKWKEYAGFQMQFSITLENGATDENGTPINPVVTINGADVSESDISADSETPGKYNLSFYKWKYMKNDGIYNIQTSATGTDGKANTESVEIISFNQPGIPSPQGHVIFMIERFAIGHGYYLEPVEVGVYDGDTVAMVMIRALNTYAANKTAPDSEKPGSAGTFADCDGSLTGDLYVKDLYDPFMKGKTANPPEYIMDKLSKSEKQFEVNEDEWLGEFDYNQMSGWVFSVNDKGIISFASKCPVKPNDVIRMMFTLHGYGSDVGCGLEGTDYREFAPLSDLFRRVNELRNDDLVKNEPTIIEACNNAAEYLKGNEQTEAGVAEKLKMLDDAVENLYPSLPTDEGGTYLISTAKQMRDFRYHVSTGELYEGKTILLTQDIDLGCSEENPWVPIEQFSGTFDGQGHKITGLYAEASGYGKCAALFKNLNQPSIVRNLGVEGNIKVENNADGAMIAGTAAGKIECCYAKGEISSSTTLRAGGIAYQAMDRINKIVDGSISNCFSAVDFKFTGSGEPTSASVGGIAYYMPICANCYYMGTADKSLPYFYPICDPLYDKSVNKETLFYNKDRSTLKKSKYVHGTPGGIGKTTEEMKQEVTYTGFNFARVWGIDSNINDGYPYLRVLNGENPQKPVELEYNIKIKDKFFDRTTDAELESIELVGVADGDDVDLEYTVKSVEFENLDEGNDIGVEFILSSAMLTGADKDQYALPLQMYWKYEDGITGNILPNTSLLPYDDNLNAYTISNLDEFMQFVKETNTWADFKGKKIILLNDIDLKGSADNPWGQPISSDIQYPFSGTFEGNGKVIKNLYLKILDEDNDGQKDYKEPSLFNYVGKDANIRNLEFPNVKIDASSNIYGSIAIFASNSGMISNCKISGEAKNFSPLGESNAVSGVALSNYGTISNCLMDMDFDIISNDDCKISGITGSMGGKIENCVVTGKMKQTVDETVESGTVSVFPVTPIRERDVSKYTLNNIYYSSENCNPYVAKTNRVQTGTNLTLDELKDQSKLAGLDFQRYWGISSAVNDGLPYLKLFEEEGAKPLVELGLNIKVKDKDYDDTLDGEIEEVILTNVLPGDEDKLTIEYDVKSVKFDDLKTGKDKTVTVVFNSVILGDTDGVTANKYTLSVKSSYEVKADMNEVELPPPSQDELVQQMKDYLNVYFKNSPVVKEKWGDDYTYHPGGFECIEWGFVDCGLNDGYVEFTEEQKENIKHNWSKFLDGLREYLKENPVPNNDFKSTTYGEILLAMTAMGYNPDDFKELDIIGEISRNDFGTDGMYMGTPRGIIAMDSGGYEYKEGSDYRSWRPVVEEFNEEPIELSPQTTVNDFTTMYAQPYIPYYNPDAKEGDPEYKIKLYFDNFIEQLSIAQHSDGRFGNVWTTDQVVILLAGLGVDLTTDSRFIKNGHTPLEIILRTLDTEAGEISGNLKHQHAQAVMSMLKVLDGRKNSIFVMDHVVSDRAKAVITAIDALPLAIAPDDQAAVEEVRAQYNDLRAMEKKNVNNYDKLVEVENSIAAIEAVINGIDSLPKPEAITLDDQEQILSLKTAYDNLSDAEKAEVTNSDKLLEAIAKIEGLQNNAAADGVIKAINKIRPIDEITSQDKNSISAARASYDELSDDSKKLVSNFPKLEAAEKRLNEILSQIQKADQFIKDTLVGVPITVDSKPLIDNVDQAIAGLTPEDLAAISSYEEYFIPAKIEYVNALISEKLMDGEKKVPVNSDNINEIMGIIDEVQAHYKSIPESEQKDIKNYEVIAELLKDAAKLDNTKEDDTVNTEANANLPRTGAKNYIPVGMIIIVMGIALLAYKGKKPVNR
jgi:hypothetical protein